MTGVLVRRPAPECATARSRRPARRTALAAAAACIVLALTSCTQPPPPSAEVAIVGLEATTYVNDSITFDIAVVGGEYDSLELRRDGELFQVLPEPTFTWDVTAAPEASYSFVARIRRGGQVFDSAPKVVVVDRSPPTVALNVAPDESPLIAGEGQVQLVASADDTVALDRLELLDGDQVVHTEAAAATDITVTPERGIHLYRAKATDRAGNTSVTAATSVPAYVRESHTLTSEAALDGCISAGYEAALFTRHFDAASCTWTTTWSILHFYSFDLSAISGALVEEAVLRIHNGDAYVPDGFLASVTYDDVDDAPPTALIYPFVSTVPEENVGLRTSGVALTQELDVTALVQEDLAAKRQHSQIRVRTQGLGVGALGGTGYFSEAGEELAPTLELDALVP